MLLSEVYAQANVVPVIRINPDYAAGGMVSDFFRDIRFIPLETTKVSTFSAINQLEVLDGHFIILDNETNAIYVFTANGKFRSKIPSVKVGKYFNFYFFSTSVSPLSIDVIGQGMKFSFDLDGKLMAKRRIPKNRHWIYGQQGNFKEGRSVYYYYEPNMARDGKDSLFKIYLTKKDELQVSFMPYMRNNVLPSSDILSYQVFSSQNHANEIFFSLPYDFTVYKADSANVRPYIKFVFPGSQSIPDDFMTNPVYTGKRKKYIISNKPGFIHSVSQFAKFDSLLVFRAGKQFIYNLKTSNLTCIDDLVVDGNAGNNFLITDVQAKGLNFKNNGFHLISQGAFYSSISAPSLFNFYRNKEALLASSPIGKFLMDNKNADANPILIISNLKTGL